MIHCCRVPSFVRELMRQRKLLRRQSCQKTVEGSLVEGLPVDDWSSRGNLKLFLGCSQFPTTKLN